MSRRDSRLVEIERLIRSVRLVHADGETLNCGRTEMEIALLFEREGDAGSACHWYAAGARHAWSHGNEGTAIGLLKLGIEKHPDDLTLRSLLRKIESDIEQ